MVGVGGGWWEEALLFGARDEAGLVGFDCVAELRGVSSVGIEERGTYYVAELRI